MPWQPPSRLVTPRLVLRPPTVDDAQEVFGAYANDREVARFMTWPTHTSTAPTEEFLRAGEAAWRTRTGHLPWLIEQDGHVVGSIGVTVEGHRVMLGYVLGRALWGQGLATEAGSAVRDAAWAHAEVRRFWAFCDIENHGSARVLEKLGMVFEGIMKRHTVAPNLGDPAPRDVRLYALTR